MEEVVKDHYIVRCSDPLCPRVMRRLPVTGRRSVGAGLRRQGIEFREATRQGWADGTGGAILHEIRLAVQWVQIPPGQSSSPAGR